MIRFFIFFVVVVVVVVLMLEISSHLRATSSMDQVKERRRFRKKITKKRKENVYVCVFQLHVVDLILSKLFTFFPYLKPIYQVSFIASNDVIISIQKYNIYKNLFVHVLRHGRQVCYFLENKSKRKYTDNQKKTHIEIRKTHTHTFSERIHMRKLLQMNKFNHSLFNEILFSLETNL